MPPQIGEGARPHAASWGGAGLHRRGSGPYRSRLSVRPWRSRVGGHARVGLGDAAWVVGLGFEGI
jgi:hypothetical protein